MILINGKFDEVIPVLDRGFLYGQGLFETIAVRDGRPRHLSRHLQRLAQGCSRIGIEMPARELLEEEIGQLLHGSGQALLKIVLTAGTGARGYRSPQHQATTRILQLSAFPQLEPGHASDGIRARICQTRLSENRALAGLKHLCRLEQVLARDEWQDAGIAEGLMLDTHGRVIEGTMSNLFLVRDRVLHTPDLSLCGVAGVMRSVILDLAANTGMETRITTISLQDLEVADELFVCNSIIGIWPLNQLDGHSYQVGPVSKSLCAAINE